MTRRGRLLRFERISVDVWIESVVWAMTAVILTLVAVRLLDLADSRTPDVAIPIPHSPVTAGRDTASAISEAAFELLAREREVESTLQTPPLAPPPRPPAQIEQRPSLRGIIWYPVVSVLLEGNGLPEGGAVLALHRKVSGYELMSVRGDSVFIKGRDSSWTLTIDSHLSERVVK